MGVDEMNISEIISKCRKLSRLSRDVSNPNEAALAASRLAELLVKYQISQIDLDGLDESDRSKSKQVDSHLFYSSNRKSHWRMSIASGCAKLFNCIPYWLNSTIYLIGREDDVKLCKYLYESIIEQVETLCSSEWNRYYLETCLLDDDEHVEPEEDDDPPCTCLEGYDPECAWEGHRDGLRAPTMKQVYRAPEPLEHRRSWSQSFLLACSYTVRERLLDKHRAMMSSLPSTSTALVVFKNRYNDSLEYAKSMSWSKSKSRPSSSSVSGYISGAKSGSKVRIDKELSHNLPLLKG